VRGKEGKKRGRKGEEKLTLTSTAAVVAAAAAAAAAVDLAVAAAAAAAAAEAGSPAPIPVPVAAPVPVWVRRGTADADGHPRGQCCDSAVEASRRKLTRSGGAPPQGRRQLASHRLCSLKAASDRRGCALPH